MLVLCLESSLRGLWGTCSRLGEGRANRPLAGILAMKTLGKFEILDKIGQGAMGVVYKARDPLIGRLAPLKTISSAGACAEDTESLERFYQEARSRS